LSDDGPIPWCKILDDSALEILHFKFMAPDVLVEKVTDFLLLMVFESDRIEATFFWIV
jgi:hypothetical protein